MSTTTNPPLNDDEWRVIREFRVGPDGFTKPQYEAKYVTDVGKQTLANELVLIKETSTYGRERIYHVPPGVIEKIASNLPDSKTEHPD